MTTARVICQSLAPRMRALAIRFLSASRTPWKALANTTKNTITTASAILEAALQAERDDEDRAEHHAGSSSPP